MRRRSDRTKYFSYLGLIDMLSFFLVCFVGLTILNITNREEVKTQEGLKMDVQFMITMTWPDQSFDDVDMHLLLPDGKVVGYNNKDLGFAVLDRDDLGAFNDVVKAPDGSVKIIEQNKEFISIRAIVPGRYVVNARVYSVHDSYLDMTPKVKLPYEASFTLTSLNPTIKEEVTRKVTLTERGKEVTAFSFTVTPDGKIADINTKEEFLFIDEGNKSPSPDSPINEPPSVTAPPLPPPGVDRDPRAPYVTPKTNI
jgi:hypothetical protein